VREARLGGRRLAAILAADVAGYSRLIRADEEGTIGRLRTLRRELIDPAIDTHNGRIIKSMGDGLLIEFASVVDAARCAVVVQRGMITRNADVSGDKRVIFRVGINLGDVVIEGDGDLMGDGMNVAARLEGLAEPGGICLSAAAYEQVRDKLDLPFADSGEQTVKNIDRPVRVYSLSAAVIASLPDQPVISEPKSSWSHASRRLWLAMSSAGAIAAAAGIWFALERGTLPTATTAPPLSIVVLPFANLSGDPQQEYFADAITEDVTTDLSRIRGSFVIAHNTAQTFKGKPVDVSQVAKELGVRYVLEGSVQRNGSVVRATVQFIDGRSGQQLWADRFDTDVTDIFKLQNQISARIANSLRLEMVSAAARAVPTHGINVDAQDYVMQAKAFFDAKPTSKDNYREVQRLYERALAIDDKSADAWAGLARTLAGGQAVFPDENRARDLQRAEAAADQAIALDPDNAEAHDASGLVQRQLQNFENAEIELERAIALDRNFALPYFELGNVETFLGKPDKALPLFEQAVRLSPHDSRLAFFLAAIGWCHLLLGDDKAGIEWGLKARSVNPAYTWANLLLADAYAHVGDEKEARAALATALRSNPHLSIRVLQQVGGSEPAWVKLADERFYDGLRKAGLPEQ
jgi:adenylate cyclase